MTRRDVLNKLQTIANILSSDMQPNEVKSLFIKNEKYLISEFRKGTDIIEVSKKLRSL